MGELFDGEFRATPPIDAAVLEDLKGSGKMSVSRLVLCHGTCKRQ